MRCLRSQSRFKMPEGGGGGGGGEGESGLAAKREILEKSGRARVLIGGCSEWRCLERVEWRSGQPTTEIRVTGGVLSSSGYSSIVCGYFWGFRNCNVDKLSCVVDEMKKRMRCPSRRNGDPVCREEYQMWVV